MKKLIPIILLLLFVSFSGLAQNNQELNYIDYHRKVQLAKLDIANANYSKALATYQTTFKKFPKHFYRDVHNACVCAIKCKQWNEADKLARELVLYGYQEKDFQTPTFANFRETEYWKKIKAEFPKLRKKYENQIDQYLYLKYRYMHSYDQHLTGLDNYEEQNVAILEFTKLVKMDYEQNGIPNFCRYKDRMKSAYQVFYRHFFGKRGRALLSGSYQYVERLDSLGIKQLLKNEILKGNLSPRFVVTAESYFKNEYGVNSEIEINIDIEKGKVSFIPSYKKTSTHFLIYPFLEFKVINNNRSQFGMIPIEEECKLYLVDTWYTQYPFREVKDALESLKGESMQIIKKKIKEIESHTRKLFKSNNIQEDFFLTDYHSYKHTEYVGLDNYIEQSKN